MCKSDTIEWKFTQKDYMDSLSNVFIDKLDRSRHKKRYGLVRL